MILYDESTHLVSKDGLTAYPIDHRFKARHKYSLSDVGWMHTIYFEVNGQPWVGIRDGDNNPRTVCRPAR